MATTERDSRPLLGSGWRHRTSSIRLRLLAWFALLLALATVGSVVVVRELLLHRIDLNIDQELVQEARELRKLAGGNDPETGRPFQGRVGRIFEVFLQRNVPSRNEALITFVGGDPYLRSEHVLPYRLDQDQRLVEQWGDVANTDRGRVDTPEGPVDYLAVPVRFEGDTKGVFVVAVFRDLERAEAYPAINGAMGVGLVVLVIGSLLAWRMANKILTPVGHVTETARSISESDLTRRIEVDQQDEIAQLATTFNDMLDRLERSFQGQKRFIDDAGHELRTPITVIRGQLEFLDVDPEEREKTIAIVMDELDRMSRFVNDLLLLARSERPDFLDLSTVEVRDLTDELQRKASALAPRDWHLENAGQGRIVADRQRLTQAVMQIAQNATQFTNEGDFIALGSAIENGEARFWVRDTGPGISEEDQSRIFARFGRGAGVRRQSEGAGLGLSIVQAIARAHHGRVDVFSHPGDGSTFTVVIPVDQPVGRPKVEG